MLISEIQETQWADILVNVPYPPTRPYVVKWELTLWVLLAIGRVTEKNPVNVTRAADMQFREWIRSAFDAVHVIPDPYVHRDRPVWIDLNVVAACVRQVLAGSVYTKGRKARAFIGPSRAQRERIADAVVEELCHSDWVELSSDLSL